MTLRLALRVNSLFSFGTGLLLALAPSAVSDWLGLSISGWLRLLGVALLGHALVLAWASQRELIGSWARLNLAAIGPYPLALIGVVAFGLVNTQLGRVLLLLDSAVVAAIAMAHWAGLRSTEAEGHPLAL